MLSIPRSALAVSPILLAGLLVIPAAAAPAPAGPPEVTNHCVASVPETDPLEAGPVKICYTLYRPAAATKRSPVPLVFHSHGWGGKRTNSATAFGSWLTAGFGVLSFDQRGFGESGGKAHVENPDFEGADVIALIDQVAKLDWVRKQGRNDPVIGAIGGSYGGGYQFVGAFTEMMKTGRTRFDALAPEITWWDLRESLAPQDVARSAWTSALYAAGADAHTVTVHQGLAYGVATGQWPGGAPAPVDLNAFFLKNGPAWHVSQGRQLDIPVAFGQGITDNLFPLDQGLKNYDRALTPRARAKSLFIGYNGGHALPSAVPPGFGVAGDPCSKIIARDPKAGFGDVALRFMQANLKGMRTGLTGHGAYHLATADGACASTRSVAPTKKVELATIATTQAAGAPLAYELAAGPLRIAGMPSLSGTLTTVGADARAFFALSVGTSSADAKVVQNNTLPLRQLLPVTGEKRTIELPSVAVDVPAGQKLFLTVSPVADMFALHGSRTPGALTLEKAFVSLPIAR
ncbi:MAG TPA: CocE/NonD family hydrolase [Mycobacteriales bacterium]|nr:CocE/NonD family hydrolase [Mycobacteriales bacterium]